MGDKVVSVVAGPLRTNKGRFSVFYSIIPSTPIKGVTRKIGGFLRCRPRTVITMNNNSTVSSSGTVHRFTLGVGGCKGIKLITVPAADNANSRIASFTIMGSARTRIGCPLVSRDLATSRTVLSTRLMHDIPPTVATSANVSILARTVRSCIDVGRGRFASTLTRGTVRVYNMCLCHTCISNGSVRTERGVRMTSYLTKLSFGTTNLKVARDVTRRLNTVFRVPRKETGTVLLPRVIRCGTGVGGHDEDRGRCLPTMGECSGVTRLLKLDGCGRIVDMESLMG